MRATTADAFASLTISEDAKRQILYSALLRHIPEAKPLRERALECLVLAALDASTLDSPKTVGEIQAALPLGAGGVALRVETINRVLQELLAAELVLRTSRRKKHAYYLTEDASRDLRSRMLSIASLLESALHRIVDGCGSQLEQQTVMSIVKRFICECFARFGRHIAKTVIGDLRQDQLITQVDVGGAFAAATREHDISPGARELLYARCVSFLRSTHPDDERLKFYLTQGYYFSQMLGFEEHGARLAEIVSGGSTFYLDTNIVIRRLLSPNDALDPFNEIVRVARRLAFEIRVSRATINEARRVAAQREEGYLVNCSAFAE